MQGALHGLRARERARPARSDLLERVGLTEAADRRVGGYSGGMRRRLDLALALVHRPRVLFLDEPTTGLDPTSRGALWREVRALNDEGTTVFLTTQYLEEAEQLADRVGIIAKGTLVAEGTPSALKARVGQPTVHVELADPEDAAAGARGAGRRSASWSPPRPSSRRRVALRAAGGDAAIAPAIRALDDADVEVASLEVETPDARRRLRRGDRLPPRGRGERRGADAVNLAAEAQVVAALGRRVDLRPVPPRAAAACRPSCCR